jgi:hypothetical protein
LDGLPSPQQRGKNRAQQERYAGLRPDERRERVWSDLATWAGGRPVFWFARTIAAIDDALPVGADYESIAEVDAPAMIGPGGLRMMASGPAGGPGRGGIGPAGGRGNFGPHGEPARKAKAFRPPPGGDTQLPFGELGGAGTKLRVVKIVLAKTSL